MGILRDKLIPWSNQFSYAQVESQYGSGQFIKDLEESFGEEDRVVCSRIPDRDAIMDSIKELMQGGR